MYSTELNMDYLLIKLYTLLKIEVIFYDCCSSQKTAQWRGPLVYSPPVNLLMYSPPMGLLVYRPHVGLLE